MTTLAELRAAKDQTSVLPGFENIKRFYISQEGIHVAKILPGEYYVTKNNETIATVLGSCVSVCIRDTRNGIGGMNHFMLPEKKGGGASISIRGNDNAARYGVYAMEHMMNDIIKYGGKKNNFEIKLCGGGRIIKSMTDVGQQNIEFIKNFLDAEGYDVVKEDLGDIYPRKVRYNPITGRLLIKKLEDMHNNTIVERETQFKSKMARQPASGSVELF